MHKTRAAVLILFLASTLAFGGCLVRQQTGKDGKGPEITMDNSEISASIHAEESELLAGVTAYDKKDGDVTSSLAVEHISNFVEKGRRKISIVAFDSDNHVTHAERELVYNDYTSPVFSLDRPLRFSLNADDLTEGLSAEDCLDGTITDRIRISYEDEISSTPGLYHVTYSVANRAGDVTSLPVTVELYDPAEENGRPQITLSDYLIHLDLQQPFDPQAYLESVSVDQMLYEKREDGALHAASYSPIWIPPIRLHRRSGGRSLSAHPPLSQCMSLHKHPHCRYRPDCQWKTDFLPEALLHTKLHEAHRLLSFHTASDPHSRFPDMPADQMAAADPDGRIRQNRKRAEQQNRLGSPKYPVRHCKKLVGHPSDCLFGGNDNLYCDGDRTQRPVYGKNHICRYGTRGGCQCGIEPVGHI